MPPCTAQAAVSSVSETAVVGAGAVAGPPLAAGLGGGGVAAGPLWSNLTAGSRSTGARLLQFGSCYVVFSFVITGVLIV